MIAQPNSTCLSTSVCGAWSVAIASAVPSARAARQATASVAQRSGGLTRRAVSNGAATRAPSVHGSRAAPSSPTASHDQRRAPAIHSSVKAMWCGVTSQVTGQAGGLRRADVRERRRRGHVGEVQSGAGHVRDDVREDRDRPGDGARLAGDRPAAQAQHGGDVALGRLGARGQGRVLGWSMIGQPQRPGIGERVAQQRGGMDRGPVVGEARDAGVGELAQSRQRLALAAGGHGAVDEDAHGRPRGGGRGHAPARPRPARRWRAWCWA